MKFPKLVQIFAKFEIKIPKVAQRFLKFCHTDSGQQGQLTLSFLEKIFEESGVRSKAGTAFVTTLLTVGIITF